MAEIEDSWVRVTAWLAANSPASYATLRPPAPAAELETCERDLGIALPAELRRLLLVNNGAADFSAAGTYHPQAAFLPGNYRLLSAAEAAEGSRALVEIADEGGGDLRGYWWHPQWVLFGSHITADGMAIDQRPGRRQGAVGEHCHQNCTEFTMGTSLGEYIEQMADSLDSGTDIPRPFENGELLRYRPYIDEDGGLSWHAILNQDDLAP